MPSHKEVSSWLNHFLASRGLNRPTGRALYTYRTTDSEFLELQNLLSSPSVIHKDSLDIVWAALFCLYGAEWYRREYRGGWTWSGIEKALNLTLDNSVRTILIQSGFLYWKREIVRYNRNHCSYLGSVYREGGLPYALLISENSRFQELFRNILAFYSQNPQIVIEPLLLLPYLTYFPEALKSETTLSLITEMATKIAFLVEKYDLSHQISPATYLNENIPDWKIDFPIPLNNDTADKLLLNLLDTAVRVKKNSVKNNERYILTQTLVNIEQFKFKVEIKFSKRLTITPLYNLNQTRCILSLYEGDSCLANITSAYVVSSDNREDCVIALRQEYVQSYRRDLKLPLFLVLEQQGVIVYREILPESEIDVEEMPLILSQELNSRVIGLGSIQRKVETLHLVFKDNAIIQLQDEYSELIEVLSLNGLKHYLLSGTAIIKYKDESFYISSKNEKLKNKLRLVGTMLPYFTSNGRPIYLGLPKISQLDDEFHLDLGQGNNASLVYGEKYARILDKSGNLIFKQKVAVLPSDFKIRFSKSKTPKEGVIEFYSNENFVIHKPNDSSIESEIIKNVKGYGKHLLVRNVGGLKSKLKLRIGVNLQFNVEMILPFPASGVQILDCKNREISPYKSLSLHELLGGRILFYPDIETGASYSIDLKNSQNNHYCFQYTVKDNPLEISLNEFKPEIISLFSVSKNLDEQVKLLISQNGIVIRQLNLTLYATDLKINNIYIEMVDPSYEIQLELLSLTTLECNKLNQNENGIFILPTEIDSPSLIIPSPDSLLQNRAVFVSPSILSDINDPLQKAISSSPEFYSNNIQVVLSDMANDFNHSGWDYLNQLYQKFNYLPLSTFLVWKELVKNNRALVAFVLQYSQTENVIEHLQCEFNVIWPLVPKSIWVEQLASYKKSLSQLPEVIIETLVNNKFDQIKQFAIVFQYEEKVLTAEMAKYILPIWCQDIQNKNIDRYWISDFSTELSNWAKKHGVFFDFKHKYQQAVIFFPFFAAAVACGKASFDSLRTMEEKDFHTFRMLMEFDLDWFNPVYKYAIQLFKDEEE